MKSVEVSIAIVVRDGSILICQRPSNGALAGYWEFPGGKVGPGESFEQCLHRELAEELGIGVRIVEALASITYDYPHANVRLHPFLCQHVSGNPQPIGCQQFAWIAPPEFGKYRFPPANQDLIRDLIRRLEADNDAPSANAAEAPSPGTALISSAASPRLPSSGD